MESTWVGGGAIVETNKGIPVTIVGDSFVSMWRGSPGLEFNRDAYFSFWSSLYQNGHAC